MDVVFDLETLDVEPTAVVLALGATWFSYADDFTDYRDILVERSFFVKFDMALQKSIGRTVSIDTINFWKSQPKELVNLIVTPSKNDKTVRDGLILFNEWLLDEAKLTRNDFVWSKGSHFDYPIINNLYKMEKLGNRISSWQVRDTKTYIMALYGDSKGQHTPKGLKDFNIHHPTDDSVKDALSITELTKQHYV